MIPVPYLNLKTALHVSRHPIWFSLRVLLGELMGPGMAFGQFFCGIHTPDFPTPPVEMLGT